VNLSDHTVTWTETTKEIYEVSIDYKPNFHSVLDFFTPDTKGLIVHSLTEAIHMGTTYDVEVKIHTAKNREIWIRIIGKSEFQNGKCIQIYGTVQDIDKQKRDRLALIESENKLKNNALPLNSINEIQKTFIAQSDTNQAFENLLNSLLTLTKSEYGFIGEVLYKENGDSFLKTFAITDISWNEETKIFYEKYAPTGMEFYNLNTLFGSVLVDKKTIITNVPKSHPKRGGLPEGHPALNSFFWNSFFCK
jgi:hypothetical protein